jgi:hypothetical protein
MPHLDKTNTSFKSKYEASHWLRDSEVIAIDGRLK